MAKVESESQLVAGGIFIFNSGGIWENGMNRKKKNGKISNGGTRRAYSLSEKSVLFAKVFHIRNFFAYRHERKSCTRRGVKTEHYVVRT